MRSPNERRSVYESPPCHQPPIQGPPQYSLDRLLESIQDVVSIVEAHGRTQYVSPSVRDVLGYSPEEYLSTRMGEWVHPDDLPASAVRLAREGIGLTLAREDRVAPSMSMHERKLGTPGSLPFYAGLSGSYVSTELLL